MTERPYVPACKAGDAGSNPVPVSIAASSGRFTVTDISEDAFEQYRDIQQTGLTNMLSQVTVRDLAEARGFDALTDVIDRGDYGDILNNYGDLVEQYGR